VRRLAIVTAVLAALIAPGLVSGAAPSPAPPAEGWGAAELRIAAAYWGVPTPPLCGSTAVQFDVPLPPEVAGEATIPAQAGTACWMKIAPARTIGTLYEHCLTVVHEYGHWLGLSHSGDVSSPMAAELNPTIHVRGCARLASVTKRTHKPAKTR